MTTLTVISRRLPSHLVRDIPVSGHHQMAAGFSPPHVGLVGFPFYRAVTVYFRKPCAKELFKVRVSFLLALFFFLNSSPFEVSFRYPGFSLLFELVRPPFASYWPYTVRVFCKCGRPPRFFFHKPSQALFHALPYVFNCLSNRGSPPTGPSVSGRAF